MSFEIRKYIKSISKCVIPKELITELEFLRKHNDMLQEELRSAQKELYDQGLSKCCTCDKWLGNFEFTYNNDVNHECFNCHHDDSIRQ